MKITKILLTAAAPVAALSLGTVLMTPSTSEGFSLIGGSLNQHQRDVRVFNNFIDVTANDNTMPDEQFPGAVGAKNRMVLALPGRTIGIACSTSLESGM